MLQFYVYLYIDPRTHQPFYVGKGSGTRSHRIDRKNKSVRGRIRILKELGLEHITNTINVETEYEAFELEKALIKQYGRVDIGTGCLFNHTDGGEGPSNPTPEVREKIAAAQRGKIHTEEHRRRVSEGVTLALSRPEVKAKLSAARKGKSSWNKGKTLSEETRKKMSESSSGISPENRERMIEGIRRTCKTPEFAAKCAAARLGRKRIYREDGTFYMSSNSNA